MRNTVKRMFANYRTSKFMLYSISLPILALTVANVGSSALRILWVMLGFSLIIFLHELGHFLVARSCSVKCLAFSLGIGPRMLGWRKGAGLSFGADPFDPDVLKNKKSNEKIAGDSDKVIVPGEKNLTEDVPHHSALTEVEGAAGVADLPQSAVAPPHPANVGDCDYRVSWLPLGGYVRMLGQDDMDPTKISNDPRAFNKRPIWQRMCIVSAGVIMNLIFAAVTFSIIFSPGIGVDFPPAQVGQVIFGSPAEKAGIKMGDKIIAIDHETPLGNLEFTDVVIASALSTGTHTIHYDILRKMPDGTEKPLSFDILPLPPQDGGSGFLSIGVSQMPSLNIVPSQDYLDEAISERKKSKADGGLGDETGAKTLSEFKIKDHITAVNGKPVADYVELYNAVQQSNGDPLKISVEQPAKSGAPDPRTITMVPQLETRVGAEEYPGVFGMGPRIKVMKAPESGTPADKAGLRLDDIILGVGERSLPTVQQFRDIVSNNAGKPLDLRVLRGTETKTLSVTPHEEKGRVVIDVALSEDKDNLTVAAREDSSEELKQLTAKAPVQIAAVDGKPVKSWDDVLGMVKEKDAGATVAITFTSDSLAPNASQPTTAASQAAGKTLTFTINTELAATLHDQLHYMLDLPVENLTFTQKADNMFDATVMGMQHTKKFVEQVYMTLRGLFNRTVSADNLHGIVGIARVGYTVQERGMVWLWYVLALVSVNLAVANFLPLPIVDGGLFLLLILEKIRGKPLSLKVQSVIQTAGIVLLAGLFLYVTYNDIFGPAFSK